jgi:hypothetical protein
LNFGRYFRNGLGDLAQTSIGVFENLANHGAAAKVTPGIRRRNLRRSFAGRVWVRLR